MATTSYAIGLGSNQRTRFGSPDATLRAAAARLPGLVTLSPVIESTPLGPSRRRFANAVALIETTMTPPDLLAALKAIERDFGRRRGLRWGARPIDCDILLWSGGTWRARGLQVPHAAFRERGFVLDPLSTVVPEWRDPVSGRTVRQLAVRARARKPVDRLRGPA